MFQRNPNEFLHRFITVDDMDPLLYLRRRNSQNNGLPGEPASKKAKIVKSAGKMMTTRFWDARGIIHIDYLPCK